MGRNQGRRLSADLTDRIVVPRSPLAALPEEIEAVVAYAKARPRDGYRRLAWMMVDGDAVYLVPSTVYRIMDKHDLLYRKLREAAARRKEVNIGKKERLVNGAPELGWSERVAEAIAEART